MSTDDTGGEYWRVQCVHMKDRIAQLQRELAEARHAAQVDADGWQADREQLAQLQRELAEARKVWRCFECGFETADPKEAEAHFGERDDAEEFKPLCRWWGRMSKEERGEVLQDTIRDLNAERDEYALLRVKNEGLEYRVESQIAEIHSFAPFRNCDTINAVFNVYDSMEGRALIAEEQLAAERSRAEKAEALDKRHYDEGMKAHRWFAKMWGEQMNGRDFDVKFAIAEQEIAAITQERDTWRAKAEGCLRDWMQERDTQAAEAAKLRDGLVQIANWSVDYRGVATFATEVLASTTAGSELLERLRDTDEQLRWMAAAKARLEQRIAQLEGALREAHEFVAGQVTDGNGGYWKEADDLVKEIEAALSAPVAKEKALP